MIARLSQQLARKVQQKHLQTLPLHENPLLDWSMQMFIFDRKQHVLIAHTRTLYSAVFLAGRCHSPHALVVAGLAAIEEQLDWDLLLEAYHRQCPDKPQAIGCAKSLNLSVTGSMNELITQATHVLADDENLWTTSVSGNRTLLSALTRPDGEKSDHPYDAMTRLLEGT